MSAEHITSEEAISQNQPSGEPEEWLVKAERYMTPTEPTDVAERSGSGGPLKKQESKELAKQGLNPFPLADYQWIHIIPDDVDSEEHLDYIVKDAKQRLHLKVPPHADKLIGKGSFSKTYQCIGGKGHKTNKGGPKPGSQYGSDSSSSGSETPEGHLPDKPARGAVASDKHLVIKITELSHLLKGGFQRKIKPSALLRIKQLGQAGHPRLVSVQEIYLSGSHMYTLMRMASNGNLKDVLAKMGPANEEWLRHWTLQLIEAIGYLHSKSWAHRNIKVENVLLNGKLNIQLTGMSLCMDALKGDGSVRHFQSIVSAPSYLAPEVLSRRPYDGFAADVWQLGILLFCMAIGEKPFKGNTIDEVKQSQEKSRTGWQEVAKSKNVPNQVVDLIGKLLDFDPTTRWQIFKIWTHPLLKKKKDN